MSEKPTPPEEWPEPRPLLAQHADAQLAKTRALVPPPDPGVYPRLDMEEYLSLDAVSASLLHAVDEGGVLYADWRRKRTDGGSSSTRLGTAMHDAILEPEMFDRTYRVREIKGTGVKAAMAEWEAQGYRLCSAEERDKALYARDSVWGHSRARTLIEGARRDRIELSFVFPMRGGAGIGRTRIDLLRDDLETAVHLKTTRGWEPDRWPYESAEYGYDITKAFYQLGERAVLDHRLDGELGLQPTKTHCFLVVENAIPCRVQVYEMGGATTSAGEIRMEAALSAWLQYANGGREAALQAKQREERVRPYDHPQRWFDRFEHQHLQGGE